MSVLSWPFAQEPKSAAACLNNIRKALVVLRKRKNMPMDYLWAEAKIRDGDSETIRSLLMQVTCRAAPRCCACCLLPAAA